MKLLLQALLFTSVSLSTATANGDLLETPEANSPTVTTTVHSISNNGVYVKRGDIVSLIARAPVKAPRPYSIFKEVSSDNGVHTVLKENKVQVVFEAWSPVKAQRPHPIYIFETVCSDNGVHTVLKENKVQVAFEAWSPRKAEKPTKRVSFDLSPQAGN
jgi:hypothetical protein